MLEGLHHIAVISRDETKALDFYVNKLGFRIEQEAWRPDRQDTLRMLRLGDVVIELFIRADAPQRPTNPEALGLRHLAFRVADVEAAARWLNDRGIATEPIRVDTCNGGRFTFFRDPDGLPLEIHE